MLRDGVRLHPHGLRRLVRARGRVSTLILDVDGVLTDGKQYLTEDGSKLCKAFGVDDTEALRDLRDRPFDVVLISGDEAGAQISAMRAKHIGIDFINVNSRKRAAQLSELLPAAVFMGDGRFDTEAMKAAAFSIAPNDAYPPPGGQHAP